MKKKLLTTAILLTGLLSAATYNYTFKISDTNLFNNSQQASSGPTMQDSTPQERTGIQSTGVILASDGGVDWYGEVSSADLISGDDLAALIGFNAGTSINSNSGWLHVGLDGQELFIAKRPFRHSISWNHINNVNAVYGDLIITIKDVEYKLRLMKGANSDPTIDASGYDIQESHSSEWNRIFYRLTNEFYLDTPNTKSSEEPFINLAEYSEEDFIFQRTINYGSYNWCQETMENGVRRLTRGSHGVSGFIRVMAGSSSSGTGWRPVLEKVN